MAKLSKLTPGAMLTLGGLVLYVINSFLPWQKLCVGDGDFKACASQSEWHGIGVLAVLLGIALLVWEAIPLVMPRPALGAVSPRLVSMGLAAALVLFTLITTLTHNEFRKIWAWIGLILAIVAAVGVWMQAKDEGVEMPSLKDMGAGGSSAGGGASTPSGGGAPSVGEPSPPASDTPAASGETPAGEAPS
jgi:hypothetical protein